MANGSARLLCAIGTLTLASFACSLFGEATPPPATGGSASLATAAPATDTPRPEPSPTRESGPCEHPLFPLAAGNRWFYRRTSDDTTADFNMLVDKVEGDTAFVNTLNMGSGAISSTQVKCKDGAILSLPMSQMGLLFYSGAEGAITLDWKSGEVLPAEREFIAADWDLEWTTGLIATGTARLVDPDTKDVYTVTLDNSPVAIEWKTAGKGDQAFEKVTVLAGEFARALRVTMQAEMSISATIEGGGQTLTLPGTLVLDCTVWFVPQIGLVMEKVNSTDVKIAGFRYPLELTTQLELREFKPAD